MAKDPVFSGKQEQQQQQAVGIIEPTSITKPVDPREEMIRNLRPEGTLPTDVPCVLPETGETFVAEIHKSSAHPSGRVVRIKDLTYPPEMVPPFLLGVLNEVQRKQWIYENHYKKLLQQFVGKPAAYLGVYRQDMQEKIKKILAEAS